MAGDINIVAIVKGDERYVFMFDDESRAEALRTLGRYASNPELSFSWYDAAVLSQKIRKSGSGAAQPAASSAPSADHAAVLRRQLLPPTGNPAANSGTFPGLDLWASDDPFASEEPEV